MYLDRSRFIEIHGYGRSPGALWTAPVMAPERAVPRGHIGRQPFYLLPYQILKLLYRALQGS